MPNLREASSTGSSLSAGPFSRPNRSVHTRRYCEHPPQKELRPENMKGRNRAERRAGRFLVVVPPRGEPFSIAICETLTSNTAAESRGNKADCTRRLCDHGGPPDELWARVDRARLIAAHSPPTDTLVKARQTACVAHCVTRCLFACVRCVGRLGVGRRRCWDAVN